MSHQSELIAKDITAYLAEHERKDMLRFLTCGNVDDGKSTLIGRLLHDSKLIYEDQLAAVQKDSKKYGTTGDVDLALLVDGLQAEREQGITIDVAYRYFSTAKRKFIIADTPGHEQYTRNMATGASTCDLAIILIDARNGVQTQTRRHTFIVSLLGIKHVVVAINKMDLVEYREEVFEKIREHYEEFADQLELADVTFIPISALKGDNIVNPSTSMPWYGGSTLMHHLETVHIAGDRNLSDFRFPVQFVNRPNLDFRGYAGTVSSGVVKPGDEVMILPSRKTNRVKSIVTFEGEQPEAFAGMAVTLTLEKEIDASRGDLLVHPDNVPHVGQKFEAMLVWMAEQPMEPGKQYFLKHTSKVVNAVVTDIRYRVNVNTLHHEKAEQLALNEIARVAVDLNQPVAFDAYKMNRATGAFVIIDRLTHGTVGAGMILDREAAAATAEDGGTRLVHVGRLAGDRLSLDILLRKAIAKKSPRSKADLDFESLKQGRKVDAPSFDKLVELFNKVAPAAERLDRKGLGLLDAALTRGRADDAGRLLLFGPEKGKKASVDAVIELNDEWLASQRELLRISLERVRKVLGA
jgi:bifunctional enzyme CysN/CysC